jgi:hypothetical protein
VLVLRPVPARIHAADAQPDADCRAALYERGLKLLLHAGFGDKYQLSRTGRSTLEITRRSVSKVTAMRDLMTGLAALSGESTDRVEAALVYVGDEFFPDGNDFEIPFEFPRVLCLSVAEDDLRRETTTGVVQLARVTSGHGTVAAEKLLTHLLNLSA